jgi:hypothetical protein
MGRREDEQTPLWIAGPTLARSAGHRFYEKLNELLGEVGFDRRVEQLCAPYFEEGDRRGRPSVAPGVYFRMLFVGYFEGIESERGLEWRCSDSLSLRTFPMELAISSPMTGATESFVAGPACRADRATMTYSPRATAMACSSEGARVAPALRRTSCKPVKLAIERSRASRREEDEDLNQSPHPTVQARMTGKAYDDEFRRLVRVPVALMWRRFVRATIVARMNRAAAALIAGVVSAPMTLGACGGGNAASTLVSPPTFDPVGQTRCGVKKSIERPLIVEWPSPDRQELEDTIRGGVAVVSYSGCEMRVLDRCSAPSTYAYSGLTRAVDKVVIRNADELYANLPVGAAKLEGTLERSGQLTVGMNLVGRYRSVRSTIRRDELKGECAGATHFVYGVSVGAFDFYAGGTAKVAGGGGVGSFKAGGSSQAERESITRVGDESACATSAPDDKAPPSQCGALIRIEVVALEDEATSVPTPRSTGVTACREGTTWDGGTCVEAPAEGTPPPRARRPVPLDIEVALQGGYGAVVPFQNIRNPGGANTIGIAVGGRAGVSFHGVYLGVDGSYNFGKTDQVTTYTTSDKSFMLGLAAGYGITLAERVTLRPRLGVGNFVLTDTFYGTGNALYFEPGVTGLYSFGHFIVGADFDYLVIPGTTLTVSQTLSGPIVRAEAGLRF